MKRVSITPDYIRQFYKLWWPIAGALLTQFSFVLVDSIMISPFGEGYLGAIGISGIFYTLIITFFNSFFDIYSNLFARKISSGLWKEELPSLLLTLFLCIITAALGAYICLCLTQDVFKVFRQNDEIALLAVHNIKILSYGVLFSFSCYAGIILLRVSDNAQISFLVILLGSIANIIGNWFFLYGPCSNLFTPEEAVAWSTLLSRSFMFIVVFFIIARKFKREIQTIKVYFYLKPALSNYIFILKKGVNTGIRNLNDWLVSFFLVMIIGQFGISTAAANQATDIISSTMYMFPQSSCITIGIMFSKWLGANSNTLLSRQMLIKEFTKLALVAILPSIMVLLVVIFCKSYILGFFFFEENSYASSIGDAILNTHLIVFPLYIAQHFFSAFLDALFDTKYPAIFSTVISYIIVIPLALFFSKYLNLAPYFIWIAEAFGIFLISCFYFYRIHLAVGKLSRIEESFSNFVCDSRAKII